MSNKTIQCHVYFSILGALCLMLSACNFFNEPESRIVLTVGTTSVTEERLRKNVSNILLTAGINDQDVQLKMKFLIDKVVDNYVILEFGKEKGITVSDHELETAIFEIRRNYPGGSFEEILVQRYVDYDEWKEDLKQFLLIEKIQRLVMVDTPLTTFQEVKRYFDAHEEEFKQTRMVQVRQVVVPSEKEAQSVYKRLKDGSDMAELAKELSITPDADNEGIMGWFSKGDLEESMDKAIFSLSVGDISKVLKTPYGYHIFCVTESRPGGERDLSEVIEEIETRLMLQKREKFFKTWLNDMRNHFPVVLDEHVYNLFG
ncbi:MAG: peptidyl-prolyl cis-trans isomerase [Deltaproteobacteria bacterium]|nr:peptidyl-prolyl cis-trans isomerase [Deltaproteobacteria bacterium]MBW1913982.1 peptidyl-prolyl cis-trans isomerase [Deltaproteobacteria bacterium]